jgi:hypothetical protein
LCAQRWQVLRSVAGSAASHLAIGGVLGTALGILFAQMRAVILISIPAPGVWMPATIVLTLALAQRHRLLGAFPAVQTGHWQVSSAGGAEPVWARNGRELFFIAGDGMLMAVPVQPGSSFVFGRPVPLFQAGQYHVNVARNYDVTPDGKRFVMIKTAGADGKGPSLVVVSNWAEEVRRRLARAGE